MHETENLSANDYDNAILSQSACNLSGLVHSFARVMPKICNEAREKGKGTEWINLHPICRLYAEQISHLTYRTDWNDAHNFCERHSQ